MTERPSPSRRPPEWGSGAVGLGDRLEAAAKTLREALAPVTAAASQVIDGFRTMTRRPDEIEVSFRVTLDSKLADIIASAGRRSSRRCAPVARTRHKADEDA